MKRFLATILTAFCALSAWAQAVPALEQIKADPRKAYGTDYPYDFAVERLTPAPRGYKPFYISIYARHGSRYYWNDRLYKQLDTLLNVAHERQLLTDEGEAFNARFREAQPELMTGISELTDLGRQQHQKIARTIGGTDDGSPSDNG